MGRLTDQAYKRIKEEILRATYPPNSPLPEAELQRSLGMGRTPVREALIRLQQQGLVKIVPRRGAFVQNLTLRDARDVYHLRAILEPEAVRLAVPHIRDSDLDRLEEEYRQLLSEGDEVDVARIIELDQAFHGFFLQKCGNPYLVETLERLHNQSQLAWVITGQDRPGIAAVWESHMQLIDALRAREVEKAAQCMKDHVLTMYRVISTLAS